MEEQNKKNINDMKRYIQSDIEQQLSLHEILEIYKKANLNGQKQLQTFFKSKEGMLNAANITEEHILQFFKNQTTLLVQRSQINRSELKQLANFILNLNKFYVYDTQFVKQVIFKRSNMLMQVNLSTSAIQYISLVQLPQLIKVSIQICQKLTYLQIIKCQKLKKFTLNNKFIKQIKFQQLPNLKILDISRCQLLQNYTAQKCEELINLNMSCCNFLLTGQLANYICIAHPKLKKLQLRSSSSIQLIKLQNLKDLKCLNLQQCPLLFYVELKNLASLERLNLSRNKLLSKIDIQNCKKIQLLNLNRTAIDDNQFQKYPLDQFLQLQILYLGMCKNLKKIKIKNLPSLKYFDFHRTNAIDVEIQNLKQLQYIGMSKCSNIVNIKFQNCPTLKKINLIRVRLYQQQIQKLFQQLPQLSELCLIQSCIPHLKLWNHQAIKRIDFANCRYLKSLTLNDISQLQQIILQYCQNLSILQISNCTKIKKLVLKSVNLSIDPQYLQSMIYSLRNLQELDIYSLYNLKMYELKLQNYKNLKKIKLQSLPSLHYLSCHSLPKLKQLHLRSNNNLEALRLVNCQKVQVVNINWQKKYFSTLLKNVCQNHFRCLKQMNLRNSSISNIEPITFIDLKNTKQIQLQWNKITSIKALGKLTLFQGKLYFSYNLVLNLQPLNKINFTIQSKVFNNSNKTSEKKFIDYNIFKVNLKTRPRIDYEGANQTKNLRQMLDSKFDKEAFRNYYW